MTEPSGGLSFEPDAYFELCRNRYLEDQALPDAFERYRLARDVEDDDTIRAALHEMARFWEDHLDSGLGEIFEQLLAEHEDLSEQLLDPVRRHDLRSKAEEYPETFEPTAAILLPASSMARSNPHSATDPPEAPPSTERITLESQLQPDPSETTTHEAVTPEKATTKLPQLPETLPGPPAVSELVGEPAVDAKGETATSNEDPELFLSDLLPKLPALLTEPELVEVSPSFEALDVETPPVSMPDPPDVSADAAEPWSLLAEPRLEDPSASAPGPDPAAIGPGPEPEPFVEPPIGTMTAHYRGGRVELCWAEENGPVRITRVVLSGDPGGGGDLEITPGVYEACDTAELRPGTVLRYKLRRVRDGEVSPRELTSEPVILHQPLREIEALEGDSRVELQWRGAAGAERIEIERRGGDELPHLFSSADSPLVDRGLVNGRRYTYRLRALYRDAEGNAQCCDEVRRSARPVPAPAPPEDVAITYAKLAAPDQPRVATLHFPAPPTGEVRIYVAREEPSWPPGTAVAHEDLKHLEGPLPAVDPRLPGRRGARYETSRFGATYFLPVAVHGLHRVVGTSGLGLDCEVFRGVRSIGDEGPDGAQARTMTWEWPSGSDRVLALWRYDQPPTDIDDSAAESRVITLGEFLKLKRLIPLPLPEGGGEIHVLLLAGVPFTFQGEHEMFFVPRYGPSSRLTWRRESRTLLRYRVKVRQGYSATSTPDSAELRIVVEGTARPLPELVLLSADRRKPLPSEIGDSSLTALKVPAEHAPRFPVRYPVPLDHVGPSRRYNLVFSDPSCYATWEIRSADEIEDSRGTGRLF